MTEAVEVRTVAVHGGTWTVRVTRTPSFTKDGERSHMFNVTGAFLPTGARRATRVVRKDRLSREQVDAYDPAQDFAAGLQADHRNARAIREAQERKS